MPSRRVHELVDVLWGLDVVEYDGAHRIRWVARWPPTETSLDSSTQAAREAAEAEEAEAAEEEERELQAEMARLQARREWLEAGVGRCEAAIAKVTRDKGSHHESTFPFSRLRDASR